MIINTNHTIRRCTRYIGIILVSVSIFSCGGSSSSEDTPGSTTPTQDITPTPVPTSAPNERYTTHSDSITSAITGINYPITIQIPPVSADLDDSSNVSVVYALDGQWYFDRYAELIAESNKNIMLVSIHQGPDNRRAIDYILPGGREYFQFLTSELIPYIELNYPASTENRTLVGESAGGIMVLNTLFLDDVSAPLFTNLLSVDPPFSSVRVSSNRELEEQRFLASASLPVNFMITAATVSASIGPFNNDVDALEELLISRDYRELNLTRRDYPNNHFTVGIPSFTEALSVFFD